MIPPDWIVLVPERTALIEVLKRSVFVVNPAGMPLPVVTSVFTPGAYTSVPNVVSGTMLEPLLVAHEEEFAVAQPPRMPLVNPVVVVTVELASRTMSTVPVATRVTVPRLSVILACAGVGRGGQRGIARADKSVARRDGLRDGSRGVGNQPKEAIHQHQVTAAELGRRVRSIIPVQITTIQCGATGEIGPIAA